MKVIPNLHSEGRPAGGLVPRNCAVTNRGSDPEGFIWTGNILSGWDREVYISIAAAKEMGRLVGMYSAEDVKALNERLVQLEEESAEIHERLDDLTQLEELTKKVAA